MAGHHCCHLHHHPPVRSVPKRPHRLVGHASTLHRGAPHGGPTAAGLKRARLRADPDRRGPCPPRAAARSRVPLRGFPQRQKRGGSSTTAAAVSARRVPDADTGWSAGGAASGWGATPPTSSDADRAAGNLGEVGGVGRRRDPRRKKQPGWQERLVVKGKAEGVYGECGERAPQLQEPMGVRSRGWLKHTVAAFHSGESSARHISDRDESRTPQFATSRHAV